MNHKSIILEMIAFHVKTGVWDLLDQVRLFTHGATTPRSGSDQYLIPLQKGEKLQLIIHHHPALLKML